MINLIQRVELLEKDGRFPLLDFKIIRRVIFVCPSVFNLYISEAE